MPDDFQALPPAEPKVAASPAYDRFGEIDLRKPESKHAGLRLATIVVVILSPVVAVLVSVLLGCLLGSVIGAVVGTFFEPHDYLPFFFGHQRLPLDGLKYGALVGLVAGVTRTCLAVTRSRDV